MSDLITETYGADVAEAMRPEQKRCSACDGTEFLRHSMFHGTEPICKPCFMIWYDYGETDPEKVGAISLALKAKGEWPWKGQYAPKADEARHGK